MIGISISTTPNRKDVFKYCLDKHLQYTPESVMLSVVEDSDYKGIAYSKNKGLEALEECEHVFLLDDDVFPTDKDWINQYLEAHKQHPDQKVLLYQNDTCVKIKDYGSVTRYRQMSGVLFSLTRAAIKRIGGFQTNYAPYAWHDLSYRYRCSNAGLMPLGDCTPNNAHLHSFDLDGTPADFEGYFKSSVSLEQKERDFRTGAKQGMFDKGADYFFEYKFNIDALNIP